MRIPAFGDQSGRLATLAAIPVLGSVLAACTQQANNNPTGDANAPNLFGETANGIGFPHEVVTTEGIASAGLYLPVFLVAAAIFILVEGLLLLLVLRFRRKAGDDSLPEQTHGHNTLEIIWTAVPALIVTLMFVGSTIVLTEVEAKSDDPGAVVDIQAFRFGWKIDYMDPASYDAETGSYQPLGIQIAGGGREGAPEIVLPTDVPVRVRLTAADVIHSWYVPAFFFKRDAIPGRLNEFELTIEQPATYGGQCAEFCGTAHSDMFFSVRAILPSEYDAWIAEQTGSAPGAEEPAPDTAGPSPDASAPAPGAEEPAPDTAGPSPDASAPATGGAVTDLSISTSADQPIAYSTSLLEAKAGQPVELTFTNDSSIPHNIAVYAGPDAGASKIAESEIVTGPGASTTISFDAPDAPGPYLFRCELHPVQMTGTLTVVP